MDQLLTERDAAKILHVSVQLLRKWRAMGTGPKYVRLGRCIRYALSDIESYISSLKCNTV